MHKNQKEQNKHEDFKGCLNVGFQFHVGYDSSKS